ncbi:hypothetical protein ONE63_006796 [Megalurothrips usitatus]|uniref:Uncharacterized protein n=1 Tax=Megalurothrips usitatus TaxID=439358 RepID=A0AAV7XWE8_9NEOP|nr:hypothetical protein ONE63_006796 [Megalurothrips usitatus]
MAVNGTRRRYSCPARFIRMGNSCYFMSAYMASWHEAHFKCRGMGAVLAAFEKRSENHNMRKYLMREELGTCGCVSLAAGVLRAPRPAPRSPDPLPSVSLR